MDVTPMGGDNVEMYHTRLDWISHIIRSEAKQMLDIGIHSQPRDFLKYWNIRSLTLGSQLSSQGVLGDCIFLSAVRQMYLMFSFKGKVLLQTHSR